ncbi:TonB family protein [Hyphococcus sp.]|uniref:TonB family protein n=1 Tax=Hyphococcus sp. TaxID=2038636 RepID=UPI003CCBF9C3
MAQEKAADIINFTGSRGGTANLAWEDAETAGAFLAAARMAAGLMIEEVSEATKVKASHLQAIEEMRIDRLPPLPYATGFVKAYARRLDLDADALAARFREEALHLRAPATLETKPAERDLPAAGEGAKLVSVFAIVAILIFGFWVMTQVISGNDSADPLAPRIRISDAPAVQPTPRIDFTAEDTQALQTAPSETNEPSLAETLAREETVDGVADGESVDSIAAETVSTPQAQTDAPPPAAEAPETVLPAATTATTLEQPGTIVPEEAQTAASIAPEPAPQETPRALPRRPRAPSPAPVVVDAQLIRSSAPSYPERCARGAAPVESVSLIFDIAANGRIANARVRASTDSCFEDEALRTIMKWRFDPKTINGAPAVDAGKSATLNFRR